jgi:hypothetical protein
VIVKATVPVGVPEPV